MAKYRANAAMPASQSVRRTAGRLRRMEAPVLTANSSEGGSGVGAAGSSKRPWTVGGGRAAGSSAGAGAVWMTMGAGGGTSMRRGARSATAAVQGVGNRGSSRTAASTSHSHRRHRAWYRRPRAGRRSVSKSTAAPVRMLHLHRVKSCSITSPPLSPARRGSGAGRSAPLFR